MTTSPEDVQRFLSDFKVKARIYGIICRDDRAKNVETLAYLDILPSARTTIIDSLTIYDYSDGPVEDTLNHSSSLWIFGKKVKGKEVYIKITIGRPGNSTICISFHISEHPIQYKFHQRFQ